jgi:hypothetical protein
VEYIALPDKMPRPQGHNTASLIALHAQDYSAMTTNASWLTLCAKTRSANEITIYSERGCFLLKSNEIKA